MKRFLSIIAVILTILLPGVVGAANYTTIDNGDNTITILDSQKPEAPVLQVKQDKETAYPVPIGLNQNDSSELATAQAVSSHAGKLGAGFHSGVVKDDGSLWVWGANDKGEVGDGTFTSKNKPVKVLDDVVSIALDYEGSAAITSDGSLYMWGNNDYGQCGTGNLVSQTTPVKVLDNVKKVSVGAFNTAAILNDGSLWIWGDNYYGQVGLGYTGNKIEVGVDGDAQMTPYILKPTKVIDSNVTDVNLGQGFSSCVKSDGSLYTWGENDSYQLGNGTNEDVYTPTKISDNVKAVSVGLNYGTALTDDNHVLSWGDNENGTLGNNTSNSQSSPEQIDGLSNITSISAGLSGVGAVDSNGDLYTWGYGNNGNLGTGNKENALKPTKVESNVDTVSMGLYHALLIKKDDSLWGSGDNKNGQLGNETNNSTTSFVKVLDNLKGYGESSSPDTYTGTFVFENYYSQVQDELKLINAERAKLGISPLTIDKSLTDTAMQRAGEINIYFDHERPNGEMCTSANSKMTGENIAAGYSDVEDVMDGWMHSDGHRANILGTQYESVGIGIAKAPDTNVIYYVQCFGSYDGTGTPDKADKTVLQKISGFNKKYLKELNVSDTNTDLKEDDSKTLELLAIVENDFTTMRLPLSTTQVKSSDPSVVSVTGTSGTGTDITIKALKEGTSDVTLASDTLKKDLTYKVTPKVVAVPIYRLYNSTSGEHLYTSDENEYNTLPSMGWTQEGVGWNAPDTGTAVYRLYNPQLADHLYTTDQNEFNTLTSGRGWQADNNGKPLFYSGGSVPVYRLYNEGNYRHLLTRDDNEYNVLGNGGGWNQEGTGLNALS